MTSQSIVAVVLPAAAGAHGGPAANVYLSPRLSGASVLSDFPDWLDWTGLVAKHGLSFVIRGPGGTATLAADTSLLRPEVWEAVFGPDSLVEEVPSQDFDERLLVSYPSFVAHDFLRFAYQYASTMVGLGEPGREVEDQGGLLGYLFSDFVFRQGKESTLDETLSQLRVALWREQQAASLPATPAVAQPQAAPLTKPADTRAMAERFALYHHLPPAPGRAPLPSRPAELEKLIDFHRAVTTLCAYPRLLPLLGLVFPLELPDPLLPASPSAAGYLSLQVDQLVPGWTWASSPAVTTPATAYVRGAGRFAAAPATSPAGVQGGTYLAADIVDGFLGLTPANFQLVGVDLDGALLKVMAVADSLAMATDPALSDGLLPSLRSVGPSLLADGRAQHVLEAIRDNKGFEAALSGGTMRALNARDVTRGYRLDVWSDRNQQWESLHRRDGTYLLGAQGDLTLRTEDEEGFVQLAAVQPASDPTRDEDSVAKAAGAPQPATDLYINERIARWNGWGLSAPRPAMPLNRSPDPRLATDPDPTSGHPFTTFKLASSFQAHPQSLPSLRFGARYRLRVRAVDLAGDSLPFDAPALEHLTLPASGELLPYYRYEPVGPPVLVLRTLPGPGGSLLELVIRSYNGETALDTVPTNDADERHVVPPKAAVQMVEHHGLLDDTSGHLLGDAATYQLITSRDEGTLPTVDGQPLEAGSTLTVPYFPDPLARSAVFTNLPATESDTDGIVVEGALRYAPVPGATPRPGSVTHVSFGPGWPDRQAFRIGLVEGHGPPTWDDSDRILTVQLPKAATTTTSLSSCPDADDLELLGVWNWMRELYDALDEVDLGDSGAGPQLVALTVSRTRLTELSLAGGNELLTPGVALTLTHAVQQPLGLPTFVRLPIVHNPGSPIVASTLANSFSPITAWRSLGSHHAVLLGALQINGASTAAIDLEARWIEPVDNLADLGPTKIRGSSPVERINLPELTGGAVAADGMGVRQVAVYIPGIDTLWFVAPFDQLDGVYTPPVVAAPLHQFGDTKHRVVRYRAIASSRFEEFFPEPDTVTSRAGPGLTVDVPSSARPEPPDVAYVLPTFGWDREVTTDTRTEVRTGNGLRVYLHRPWYSSGADELLGVTLWPATEAAPGDDQREANKAYFTQWGLDPIWSTGPIGAVPWSGDFTDAARSAANLSLPGTTFLVDVAGHEVAYDQKRQLWFCDIELANPASYMPFVRLALARYQPRSIAGTELSSVVLTNFAQVAPDRSAALTIDPAEATVARLVVAGLAPIGSTRNTVTVSVERRRSDVLSDLGWEPAPVADARIVEQTPPPYQAGSVLYAATVRLPQPPQPGQWRVVIREFEVLQIDPPASDTSGGPSYGSRLVYASILPLDVPPRPGPGENL